MTRIKRTLAVLAVTGASVAAWAAGQAIVKDVQFARTVEQVQNTREQLQKVEDLSTVFRNVGKAVEPSVVQIQVRKTIKGFHKSTGPDDEFLRRFFKDHGMPPPGADKQPADPDSPDATPDDGGDPLDGQEVGTGSGVVMEVNGDDVYIVTNNHVAGGATELTVTLNDGREIKNGKTLGADAKSDLAVVKISAPRCIAAKWGDSDSLDRGDWVLAFGSPFGYVGSMTHGIVSALNRQAGILGNQGYENFIQVDAPINPGNSGGPLVNIHGDVVGINTAIATRNGGFQGIGFAIPSNQAKAIFSMLKEKGKVTRGWLGVSISDVTHDPNLAKSFGYDGNDGVIVQQVLPNTPSIGKLQAGDIITSLNGKPVRDVRELRNHIAMLSPNENTTIGVFRDKKQQDIQLKLGEQPENIMAMGPGHGEIAPKAQDNNNNEALGMRLSDVTDDNAQKFGLGDARDGALIIRVDPKSAAAKAGLRPGDVITRVGGQTVSNAQQANDALTKADAKAGIRFYVTNRDGSRFMFLQSDDGK